MVSDNEYYVDEIGNLQSDYGKLRSHVGALDREVARLQDNAEEMNDDTHWCIRDCMALLLTLIMLSHEFGTFSAVWRGNILGEGRKKVFPSEVANISRGF